MSYQDEEEDVKDVMKRSATWRGNIPSSCPSCVRHTTRLAAEKHARETSLKNRERRHVIHTGDYFFSSTTAQLFFYEELIITYEDGKVIRTDIKKIGNTYD